MKKLSFSALAILMVLVFGMQAYAANGHARRAPEPTPNDPTVMGPIDPFPPPPSRD